MERLPRSARGRRSKVEVDVESQRLLASYFFTGRRACGRGTGGNKKPADGAGCGNGRVVESLSQTELMIPSAEGIITDRTVVTDFCTFCKMRSLFWHVRNS
jgi:hypothetical protein